MYNKELETDKQAWLEHQANLKKNAADRLAANAKWNKANKRKKNED